MKKRSGVHLGADLIILHSSGFSIPKFNKEFNENVTMKNIMLGGVTSAQWLWDPDLVVVGSSTEPQRIMIF